MKKQFKAFILYPDVTIMAILFIVVFVYTAAHLLNLLTWIALILGLIFYAISEYLVHRFLFHMKAPKRLFFLKLMKRLHYDHHDKPKDLHLLFLPLWFSLPNFFLTSFIFYLFTTNFQLSVAFLTGIIAHFLYYEWTHFVAHMPIKPRTKFGKKLKKTHLWHHYKNENYWYGVTHLSIDKTLGTYKDHTQVEKSQTAKNLEKRV